MLFTFLVLPELYERPAPVLVGICVLNFDPVIITRTLIATSAFIYVAVSLITTSAVHGTFNERLTRGTCIISLVLIRYLEEVMEGHVESMVEDTILDAADVKTAHVYILNTFKSLACT
jgi:hypothetical protein